MANGHGGIRDNSGRKGKAEEQKLIEKLGPLMPEAFAALKDSIADRESWAVKMAFEYFYGKATETKNINLTSPTIKITYGGDSDDNNDSWKENLKA